MWAPFDTFQIPLGRGLNLVDAPEAIGEGELREAANLVLTGEGFVRPRRAMVRRTTLPGEVCGIFSFPHALVGQETGVVYAVYIGGNVRFYTANTRGQGAAPITDGTNPIHLWTGLSEPPHVQAATLGRRLFLVCEDRSQPMLIYDPFRVGGPPLYAPSFQFVGGDAAPILGGAVAENNNIIFVAGYGSELDQNRPEVIRFSYLGLEDDGNGDGGDAGADDDSMGLFDRGDYFMLTERGVPVVGMLGVAGRMVILTPFQAHHLFGYSRDDFHAELLDPQRGLVAGRALIAAHGAAYWWSPLGPCRYAGAQVEPLDDPLLPVIDSLRTERMFAAHHRETREIRWYFPTDDDTDYYAFNYRKGQWTRGRHAHRITCAGRVAPQSYQGEQGTVSPPPPPVGPPEAINHDGITAHGARTYITPGDAAAEIRLERSPAGAGMWSEVAILPPGSTMYEHTGLAPSSSWDVRARHRRNGFHTSYLVGPSFTTRTLEMPLAPPIFPEAEALPGFGIRLTWRPGQNDAYTVIYRAETQFGQYTQIQMVEVGVTEFRDLSGTADRWYRLQHESRATGERSVQTEPFSAP